MRCVPYMTIWLFNRRQRNPDIGPGPDPHRPIAEARTHDADAGIGPDGAGIQQQHRHKQGDPGRTACSMCLHRFPPSQGGPGIRLSVRHERTAEHPCPKKGVFV